MNKPENKRYPYSLFAILGGLTAGKAVEILFSPLESDALKFALIAVIILSLLLLSFKFGYVQKGVGLNTLIAAAAVFLFAFFILYVNGALSHFPASFFIYFNTIGIAVMAAMGLYALNQRNQAHHQTR